MDSHVPYIFRKLSSSWCYVPNWHNAATYRFRDIHGQMAKISVWKAKNGPPEALFDPLFGDF